MEIIMNDGTVWYCTWLAGSVLRGTVPTHAGPEQALRRLAQQPISIPGERGFALEGIVERPGSNSEAGEKAIP